MSTAALVDVAEASAAVVLVFVIVFVDNEEVDVSGGSELEV